MVNDVQEWTLDGVLDEIAEINARMDDRSLAFILGAGASFTSGIPTGGQLAERWLKEIHFRECGPAATYESWLADGKHHIDGLTKDTVAECYARIFERRFGSDFEMGYAALENAMEGKEPGLGYSLMAHVIQHTRHKVVITTNFDNLVAEALAIHGHRTPLVVGHESLAGFARPQMRRPLVAKIHRDLFFSPKNNQLGTDTLEAGWQDALRRLFQTYSPIVIGYGGNDGSLMGFLEKLAEGDIRGKLIWCYLRDTTCSARIDEVIKRHNGVKVAISGFDEFMLLLANKLVTQIDLAAISGAIEEKGKQRANRYREQAQILTNKLGTKDLIEKRTSEAVSDSLRDNSQWWTWLVRATLESEPSKKTEQFEKAIHSFPNEAQLYLAYSEFLASELNDLDGAIAKLKKAYDLDPKDADISANFAATYLAQQDLSNAEKYAQSAIDLGKPYPRQSTAESLFYLALIFELRKSDPTPALQRLKGALGKGYDRYEWSFDFIFKHVLPNFEESRGYFYRMVGAAILDEDVMPQLEDAEADWRTLKPRPAYDPF